MAKIIEVLREVQFGNQVAEEEKDELSNYFVETQSWRKIIRGDIDVVYGPKGAGKSALYLLVQDHESELFDKGVLLVVAENPRGAAAFESLKSTPPTEEREFINLWKLYFISLIGREFLDYGINNRPAKHLMSELKSAGLLVDKRVTLRSILSGALSYIRKYANPKGIEGTVHTAEGTGAITAVSGIIHFGDQDYTAKDGISIDELYALATEALAEEKLKVWLLLDRLDVAFDETDDLEKNALRALFKGYGDLRAYPGIILKIFLRTDIWDRITDEGFREATHISREIRLEWDKPSLMNLVVRRFLNNKSITDHYKAEKDAVIGDANKQTELMSTILPAQVEIGEKQSETFDWILRRTTDGTGKNAPREIIVFFNALIDAQIKRLERGEHIDEAGPLFDRGTFKDALPSLSEYRLTKVIYAENPHLKKFVQALNGEKSEHNAVSLGRVWSIASQEATRVADDLVRIGFFEGGDRTKSSYKIPFIYRPALNIVQGKAEEL